MANQFLDKDGLDKVAEKVNTRLKTVTEMPVTANDGAVRLYVGETSGGYTKGHTYQAKIEDWDCYKTTPEVDPSGTHYIYLNPDKTIMANTHDGGLATTSADLTNRGEIPDNYDVREDGIYFEVDPGNVVLAYVPDSENDLDEFNWVDITPAGGAVSADDVSYTNEQIPSSSNVEGALDAIIGKIYYVNPSITSFTMTPSTTEYEIGSTVNELAFNWTYNKNIVSQTLTDCTLADETVRTATYSTPITSNKTFTLTASDGENSVTASKSVSFKHKVYWGAAAEPAEFTSAFILALTGKKFATNFKGSYSMNLGTGEYGYVAYPSSWGTISSWWISGFEVETYDCGTIEFTNASGNTTTFRITRTTQPSLGSITAEVK